MNDEKEIQDITNITNIQERRKALIPYYSKIIGVPYNQYITNRNTAILQQIVCTMFNASMVGYEYQYDIFNQTGKEKEDAGMAVLKIQKSFQDVVLTDDEYDKVLRFALAMRNADVSNIYDIILQIEKFLTPYFLIISSPRRITYVLYISTNIAKAIHYYKLLPNIIQGINVLIGIPEMYIGYKVWLWGMVNPADSRFYLPSIGSYWMYHRVEGQINAPLLIMPEWVFVFH